MNPKVVGAIALAGVIIVLAAFTLPGLMDDPAENPGNDTEPVDPEPDPDEPWDPNVTVEVGPITGPDDPPDDGSDDGRSDDDSDDGGSDDDSDNGGSDDDGGSDEPSSGLSGNTTAGSN